MHSLKQLEGPKAGGPCRIHPKIVTRLEKIMAKSLTLIFEAPLDEGRLSGDQFASAVMPVHEGTDRDNRVGCRPVNMRFTVLKTTERICAIEQSDTHR